MILLKKYPTNELKSIIKKECNIDRVDDEALQVNIIEASKRLRLEYHVNEKNVCFNCSKKTQCKFFEQVPDKKDKASPLDLALMLYGVYINTDIHKDIKLKLLENPIKEVLNNNALVENVSKTSQFVINDPVLARFTNRDWNSANILMEINLETFDDLLNNEGVSFKALVNAYIESQAQEKVELIEEKLKAETKKEPTKEDLIVKLVEDLELCKNRKEKRILLAKFNKEVGFGLGEFKKINTKKVYEEDVPTEQRRKESNKKENTKGMSSKRLENIEKYDKKLITQRFTQKIDFKKQKALALEGQQNLSLLMNKTEEDRTLVKVPGKDFKRGYHLSSDKKGYMKEIESKK
jgi:hypothetical protein